MKNILKISLFYMVFMATSTVFSQQLPQFSQYMFNGLHINPGYAGYKGESYIQSTYRSQWVNFPGAPETFTVTGDFSANEGTMGFGFSVLSDRLGPVATNGVLLTYAYRIQTGMRSFLGLGVSAGVSEYAIDGSMLDPNDHPDVELPEGRVNLFTPNMNAGIFFNTPRFYAGLSMYNLVGKKSLEREDVALAYHDFHYYLTAGAILPLSEKVQIKPSFLIKEVKGAPTSYDLNTMFLFFERVWLGGSYRSNMKLGKDNLPENLSNRNSIAMIIEFFATNNLRIGYAYDHNLNVLDSYRNNSHEISIGYYISPKNIRMRNQRWF
ncbi:type IX secretion system membrane protein PorP/SprF [Echinicola soli]|uniref:Type IX secretion system membrane protein PorP/SprF n=1 Tax=Echinicola soli TaxID=2591634 RepID=A0A514CKE7_9BACT|nr:type IX secretion system membrane protein PorP/SprF [Echinicola soli]QDH80282.1 type IX secretion system membrane protein PorP/SprF [Echinicola soli]